MAWRKLANAVNQYLEKGPQLFVESGLCSNASDDSQNPRIWIGNDGEARARYEASSATRSRPGRSSS